MQTLPSILLLLCLASAAAADDQSASPPQAAAPFTPLSTADDVIPDGPEFATIPSAASPADDSAPEAAGYARLTVIEEAPPLVDLRLFPSSSSLADDDRLLYRETRNETAFVSHRGGFGLTTLGFSSSVDVGDSNKVSFRPRFGWHFLHGPLQPDLPPQLYDLALEVNFRKQVNDDWSFHLLVTPTLATDFDNKDSEAFRLIAGGLVAAQLTSTWKFVGGLTYLDRPDLPVVPIAGLRMRANDFAIDLLVPRPRLAYRYSVDSDHAESWVYVGGEIGGGSWAYERENTGLHDIVGYRDFRIVIGTETNHDREIQNVMEAGYVFERHLEFDNGPGDFSPGGSWMLRAGFCF